MCRCAFFKSGQLLLPFQKLSFEAVGIRCFFTTQVLNLLAKWPTMVVMSFKRGLWSRFQSCLGLDLYQTSKENLCELSGWSWGDLWVSLDSQSLPGVRSQEVLIYIVSEEEMRKGAIVILVFCLLVLRWKAKVELQSVGSTNVWHTIRETFVLVMVEFSRDNKRRKSTISFTLGTSSHLCRFTSQVSVLPEFQGFGMMKGMGTPFLLFSGPLVCRGIYGTEELWK